MRNALFGLDLRIKICRERLRENITTRTVSTPTGEQMSRTMEATKTASLFRRLRTNGTMTNAHIWCCPFVKWTFTCNFCYLKYNTCTHIYCFITVEKSLMDSCGNLYTTSICIVIAFRKRTLNKNIHRKIFKFKSKILTIFFY